MHEAHCIRKTANAMFHSRDSERTCGSSGGRNSCRTVQTCVPSGAESPSRGGSRGAIAKVRWQVSARISRNSRMGRVGRISSLIIRIGPSTEIF